MSTYAGSSRTLALLPLTLLVAVVALAACAGPVVTAPANTLALSPAPGSSSGGGPSPSASLSPSADLTAQAAQAYLALATKVNADINAMRTLSPAATLDDVKAYYQRRAEIEAEAVAGLEAISFPPRLKDDVENLIRATNALRSVEASIAASASIGEVTARNGSLGSAFDAMGRAADNLRDDLGLAPIAAVIAPPSLRPAVTPSAASSIDPSADLRIGPPYELEPMDAATTALFQAQLKAALGSLANSFRFGLRWVAQGGQHVALVMVMQVPGAGAVVTSPGFLEQIAASMAGVSIADVITSSILGQSVRLVDKTGMPLAIYAHGEGVVMVIGLPGSTLESVTAVATALIRVSS